jgi:AraC family transcriptional regulator, transcriptional activator FtrA
MIDAVRDKPANRSDHKVAVVVYDGFAPFDLGVVCEVFGEDPRVAPGDPWYRLFICGDTSAPVTADTGFQILVPHGLETLAEVDTVIVTPTYRPDEVAESVFAALRQAHARGCRILSLCTGAFVLARAGLLDGRRAATHWTECDDLARRFPLVSVDADVLYVDEGDILTGAGSAASIDLLLHLVRQDYGSDVATQLARQLVVPPQRDGGQAQFISQPLPDPDDTNLFADTMTWVQEHLDDPVTVEDLAQRSAMSPRTFARRFQAATGTTAYQWLLGQRVHLA